MKRMLLLFICLFLSFNVVFSDHSKGLGIGILSTGDYGRGYRMGLSLVLPTVPYFFGIYYGIWGNGGYLYLTGDKYIIDNNLAPIHGQTKLDWYLGLGLYGYLGFFNNIDLAIGLRIPIGLSLHIVKFFEIILEVAPSFGLNILPTVGLDIKLPITGGFRIWF